MRFVLLFAVLQLVCVLSTQPACAQAINRCQNSAGKIIYTDKVCEDIGAVPQAIPKADTGNIGSAGYNIVRTCSHTIDDLLWDFRGALETGDTTRASGLFLWNGTDTAQADQRLNQLNQVSYQSLISVDLLFPEPDTTTPAQFDANGELVEPASKPAPAAYAIRVIFYSNKKQTETSTLRFGIERYMQCYWLRF